MIQLFLFFAFSTENAKNIKIHHICLIFIISNLIITDYPFLNLLSLICMIGFKGNFASFQLFYIKGSSFSSNSFQSLMPKALQLLDSTRIFFSNFSFIYPTEKIIGKEEFLFFPTLTSQKKNEKHSLDLLR